MSEHLLMFKMIRMASGSLKVKKITCSGRIYDPMYSPRGQVHPELTSTALIRVSSLCMLLYVVYKKWGTVSVPFNFGHSCMQTTSDITHVDERMHVFHSSRGACERASVRLSVLR